MSAHRGNARAVGRRKRGGVSDYPPNTQAVYHEDAMTARLGARLLGRASFAFEGREVVLRSRKAAAMLAYLCLRPAGATRDVLAETFWALGKLASVRQALYELRKLPGADEWLSDEGDLIRVFANTDVDAFVEAVSSGDSATALALYGGELLEGDLGLEHPPFQEWLASARARLFTLHLEA